MSKRKKSDGLKRCAWAEGDWGEFHDDFGKESRDSRKMFETLCLCSQSAGLNWRVVWSKKDAYDEAFHYWDIDKVAKMKQRDIDKLVEDHQATVIRNRRKLEAIVTNAKAAKKLKQGFAEFVWGLVDGKPVVNHRKWKVGDLPPMVSKTSMRVSRELKKAGFAHIGPKTVQTFCCMVGVINDHCATCFMNPKSDCYNSTLAKKKRKKAK